VTEDRRHVVAHSQHGCIAHPSLRVDADTVQVDYSKWDKLELSDDR